MSMFSSIPRLLVGLKRNRKGSVLIELAFAIPVIMVLITGGFEITRYALLYQKVTRMADTMADLVSQAKTVSETDLDGLFDAVNHVAQPFDVAHNGEVIVTSVSLKNNVPTVNWQRTGGGTYNATSKIGSPGGTATLPQGFVLHSGDTVIIAEAFYNYTPAIFTDLLSPKVLYNVAYFRPRLGSLDSVSAS